MNKIKLTTTRLFVVAFLLCFLMTLQAQAAPGDLDPSFGNGGKVVTSISGSNAYASDIAIQSDGKIVAVGNSGSVNTSKFTLARYNTDGSLDITFGTGGIVATPIGDRAYALAVAIQSDGKIVAVGFTYATTDFVLVRYNTNGSLDTTFGTGGIVRTSFAAYPGKDAALSDIAIQSDGKIVAVGGIYDYNEYESSFALVRYNTNGSPDTSFGTGGMVTTQFDSSENGASSVAIQSDGKIVAAGSSGNSRFALARYNTDGSLDSTFGIGGKVVTSIGGNTAGASDIAIQSDGKIVAAGISYSSGNSYKFALARYNTNGSLDTTFGTGGIVVTLVGESGYAEAVAIQSNGKIVVAGDSRIGNINNFALARYNTDGSLDTSFGTGGKILTPIGSGGAGARSVAIQPNGRIVAAGYSRNGTTNDFALVRYLGDSNTSRTQFDFDGDGKADISVFRPTDRNWYVLRSSSGFSAAQFGNSTDKIVPADFDGDGKTDIAVFRDGTWYWLNSLTGNFNAVQFGLTEDIPVPADYTGDGQAELAVYRAGFWYTLNLANNQFQAVQFGNPTDKPVPADFDADGKTDFAVYRDGTWHLLRSMAGIAAVQFGNATDKPVVGDYDGDAKADQAVYRDGFWYVFGSTQGSYAVQFGLSSDIPTPADYDGDGKTDIAVFRDGVWYLQRPQQGFAAVQFGTTNDKPVPAAFTP